MLYRVEILWCYMHGGALEAGDVGLGRGDLG